MKSYHFTVLVIGIGLAVGILMLVRRDHLYIRQGLFWIGVAFFSLALAVWPYLIDTVGGWLGVAYPPTLLLLVAIIVLVVKALLGDIALTKVRRDLRRLNQRIALIEADQPGRGAAIEAAPGSGATGGEVAGGVGPPGFEPGTKGL